MILNSISQSHVELLIFYHNINKVIVRPTGHIVMNIIYALLGILKWLCIIILVRLG